MPNSIEIPRGVVTNGSIHWLPNQYKGDQSQEIMSKGDWLPNQYKVGSISRNYVKSDVENVV